MQQPPPPGPWQRQPYPYQPQQQWPYPPPRRRPIWPWIVGGSVAVLLVLVVVGAALGNDPKASTATTRATPATVAAAPTRSGPTTASAGSAVSDGKLTFQVTDVQSGIPTIGDNQYLWQTAQGQFIKITLNVSNNASATGSFFGQNQKLVDAQGRQFTHDAMAELNLSQQIETDVNPGNQTTVTVVYDIPVGDQPTSLELHDSAFSGGVRVALN